MSSYFMLPILFNNSGERPLPGQREHVSTLSRAAVAVGVNGLFISPSDPDSS